LICEVKKSCLSIPFALGSKSSANTLLLSFARLYPSRNSPVPAQGSNRVTSFVINGNYSATQRSTTLGKV
jgi:hypothetical protein